MGCEGGIKNGSKNPRCKKAQRFSGSKMQPFSKNVDSAQPPCCKMKGRIFWPDLFTELHSSLHLQISSIAKQRQSRIHK
eukprot:scaffold13593_cov13-Tisochrysis_lutea.AAC.1